MLGCLGRFGGHRAMLCLLRVQGLLELFIIAQGYGGQMGPAYICSMSVCRSSDVQDNGNLISRFAFPPRALGRWYVCSVTVNCRAQPGTGTPGAQNMRRRLMPSWVEARPLPWHFWSAACIHPTCTAKTTAGLVTCRICHETHPTQEISLSSFQNPPLFPPTSPIANITGVCAP